MMTQKKKEERRGNILAAAALIFVIIASLFALKAEARYAEELRVPVPVTIQLVRRQVAIPEIQNQVYTGGAVSCGLVLPEGVTASGGLSGTNVGTYTVVLHLTDPERTEWEDGTVGDRTLTWHITRKYLTKPTVTNTTRIYSGSSQGPTVTGYNETWMTRSGTVSAASTGSYSLTFQLRDPQNTAWMDGTTSNVQYSWGIYVCHVGTVYYTSVGNGLSGNRSTASSPLVLDCNYTESPTNSSGTDYFNLNGKTLTGTVTNSATLTIYGGTVSASGSSNDVYALRNSGTLSVTGGTYRATSSASATSGKEVWGLYSTAGTTTVSSGCSFIVSGPNVAACGYQLTGGTVNSAASVTATSQVSSHGAYYAYMSGGTLNVTGGSSQITNNAGFAYLIQAAGGTVGFSGGTHTVRAGGTASIFLSTGGNFTISGGTTDLLTARDCNVANVSVGNITLTGGTHTAVTTGNYEARCLFRASGTITLNGATVRTGTPAGGFGALNMQADTTKTKMRILSGNLYVRAGTAYCAQGQVDNAWISVSSTARFYIYYKNAHSCGRYFTANPVHSVLTTTNTFTYGTTAMFSPSLLSSSDSALTSAENGLGKALSGTFSSLSGSFVIGGLSSQKPAFQIGNVSLGDWQAEVYMKEGKYCEIKAYALDGGETVSSEMGFLPLSGGISILTYVSQGGFDYDVRLPFFVSEDLMLETIVSDGEEPSESLRPIAFVTGFMTPFDTEDGNVTLIAEKDAEGKVIRLSLSSEALKPPEAERSEEEIPEGESSGETLEEETVD